MRTELPNGRKLNLPNEPNLWDSDDGRFAWLPTKEFIPEDVYDRVQTSGSNRQAAPGRARPNRAAGVRCGSGVAVEGYQVRWRRPLEKHKRLAPLRWAMRLGTR